MLRSCSVVRFSTSTSLFTITPSPLQQPCDLLERMRWYRLFLGKYVWISYINGSRLNLRQTCTRSSTLTLTVFPTCRAKFICCCFDQRLKSRWTNSCHGFPRSIQLAHPAKEPASKKSRKGIERVFPPFFTVFLLENNGESLWIFNYLFMFSLKIGSQLKFLA